ncbi:hypothetical protein KUTeg_011391 [Tegillarca granosa]|uniref:Phospholipid/glycerol acyltransferase domain-containing protein n=1 Tax=Tegillarca granosa TaxID=220873 RepID=A0ABQ9F465_TEGGR|nr:hypothetical protein KUTeg_011391 [Tegillarca granosa]
MNGQDLLYYTLRVLYITFTNFIGIPAYITWYFLLFPLRKLNPRLYWKIEAVLFKSLLGIISGWMYSGGYKLIESGDDLSDIYDTESIVMVNHQSSSDVPIVMASSHPKGMVCGQLYWIMDYIFKFTNFGWVSYFHGDFFILQGKEHRNTQLVLLKKHLQESYLSSFKKWIVLFPEGGFLYKRRQRNQEYAKKNDLPILEHVTFPRTGAIKVILDTLSSNNSSSTSNGLVAGTNSSARPVKWIIDMTIGYPNAEPLDLHGMCIGYWSPRDIRVHYKAYPVDDIPHDTEGLTKWLYQRYIDKEHMLSEFYKSNTPLDESDTEKRKLPRVKRYQLQLDSVGIGFYHVFNFISTYLFWNYIYCYIFGTLGWLLSFVF